MVYADSSLIVSCYFQDTLTTQALAAMSASGLPAAITDLHRLEISNATKLAVFRNRITKNESDMAWSDFLTDYRAGKFIRRRIDWRAAFRVARKLAAAHSVTLGTRSLDILHVSAAKQLGTTTFLTFDKRQRLLAQAVGMQVLP